MRNIGRLIYRYHIFLVFLALQLIAFALLVKNNNYQESVFINTSNHLIGTLYEKRAAFSDYLKLSDFNDELSAENAQLKSKQLENFMDLENGTIVVNDTLFVQRYEYLPAKVINNSVNTRNNYITLNKGSITGVKPEMGVVANGAMVGIIKDVSKHFSSVMPIINPNFTASIKLKKGNDFGMLAWKDKDPRYAQILEIPKHANVQIGDSVITTGFSSFFPEGLLVGTIAEIDAPEGENFYTIRLLLKTDFYKLSYVKVVSNLMKEEQLNLENEEQP
jgi:rod shape-determining protein MreC